MEKRLLCTCVCRLLLALIVGLGPTSGTAIADGLGVPGTTGGLVATSQPLAARAGETILERGGNAIDAAVAVAFALAVVEPQSSGIGGGGFTVIHLADSGRTVTVDSRETAPAAATADMFVPFAKGDAGGFRGASTTGLSVGVPGMIRGVELMLERWGTRTFAETLAPAIDLAANGFYVGPRLAESVRHPRLAVGPGDPAREVARAVFMPDGEPLERGDLLRQPAMARTLKTLAKKGPDAFYTGEIAEAIVRAQRYSRTGDETGAGRMSVEDLTGYRARVRPPVAGDYRGFSVRGMGPPSSGGLTVLQILGLLERFPLGDATRGFGELAPDTLHVMVEAMRLAFADRAVWMGDADHVPVPVAGLLHPHYLAERSALIDRGRRMTTITHGEPRPFDPAFDAGGNPVGTTANPGEGRNTTHFTVVDRAGNIVSYTNTIESAWGSGLMVPGHGFLLNNELTDFNFLPRAGENDPGANDVAPGKRPRSSISPVIVYRDGEPVAAYGSPGGSTIINTVANITVNLVDHGLPVQQAVDLPRISQTRPEGAVSVEPNVPMATLDALRELGHQPEIAPEIGSVQAVVIDRDRGLRFGAADRRRVGAVRTAEPAPAAE